jgi:hypothetical protein
VGYPGISSGSSIQNILRSEIFFHGSCSNAKLGRGVWIYMQEFNTLHAMCCLTNAPVVVDLFRNIS